MTAVPSPNVRASSSTVPMPTRRPDAKMPIRSQTDWTWVRRWLDSRIAMPALVGQPPQQVEDLDHAERVDRRRRLVEDEQVGRLDQRVGDAQPLAHAARVGLDRVVGAIGQADLLEDLVDGGFRLGLAEAVEPRRVAQVLATGHARRRSRPRRAGSRPGA